MVSNGAIVSAGGVRLAWAFRPGRSPVVAFLPGFRSDMTGTKATHLDRLCESRQQACLRFDYSGHGASGGRFEDGTIGGWFGDALAVLGAVTDDRLVLVGSSMGGWIMSLLARRIAPRLDGLVGVASAPDFTDTLIWNALDEDRRQILRGEGRIEVPSTYEDGSYPVTMALIEDGRAHRVLGTQIPVTCPVHLIHGTQDPDVPWGTSLDLAGAFEAPEVLVTLIKDGDHRLSSGPHLDVLTRVLVSVLDRR